jgi:pyrimidine operon attenuation protein/uracil phosphoribosyltransferase
VFFERLKEILEKEYQTLKFSLVIGYHLFRDDFRRTDKPLEANKTKINFIVEIKKVIFIDDVLFTGRSILICVDCYSIFLTTFEIELQY